MVQPGKVCHHRDVRFELLVRATPFAHTQHTARRMSLVPRGACRDPHISQASPGLLARPADSADSQTDPVPNPVADFERGVARAGAKHAVPSARMEWRA